MAIKIDLEKAYDRLNWDFIKWVLVTARLSSKWVENIMKCISTSSMSVLWNGEVLVEFFPTREIRQGGSLSPYIFVICIEQLSHLI